MRIALTGASGYVGRGLRMVLEAHHFEVIPVSRKDFNSTILKEKLAYADGVIHLAGESIGGIWTKAKRKRIYESRVFTTRRLVDIITELKGNISFFITISGVGIYDTDHIQTERSAWFAEDFLAQVIRDWEDQANRLLLANVRVAVIRSGVVLSDHGGILKLLMVPFNIGFGYGIRSFHNFPVIHYTDLMRVFLWIVEHPESYGVYNAVLPEFLTIHDFFCQIGKRKNKRLRVMLSPLLLKMMMGESSILLTKGQWVVPQRILNEGFLFEYAHVGAALDDCI